MQKKVYTKDLSLDEIKKRLEKGEKILNDNDSDYFVMHNNVLAQYEDNTLIAFNPTFYPLSDTQYFLDEVEEPEADDSCIDKLCWFWSASSKAQVVGILLGIRSTEPKYESSYCYYNHCKPLTKEEALALVKE